MVEDRKNENSTADESTVVLERNSGKRVHWELQSPQDIGDILGIAGTVYHCQLRMHKSSVERSVGEIAYG